MLNMLVIAGIIGAAWYYWPQIKAFVGQAVTPKDDDEPPTHI